MKKRKESERVDMHCMSLKKTEPVFILNMMYQIAEDNVLIFERV